MANVALEDLIAARVVDGVRVIACPFAHNTAGLLTGAAVYTPTIGDILLNAWIAIITAWDGTTPQGDFSQFTGSGAPLGLLGYFGTSTTMDSAADTINNGGGPRMPGMNVAFDENGVAPGVFTSADPIKVVVSQNGTITGADPGSTQGAAILYLVVATPIAP
jgi:hypothetical protein